MRENLAQAAQGLHVHPPNKITRRDATSAMRCESVQFALCGCGGVLRFRAVGAVGFGAVYCLFVRVSARVRACEAPQRPVYIN